MRTQWEMKSGHHIRYSCITWLICLERAQFWKVSENRLARTHVGLGRGVSPRTGASGPRHRLYARPDPRKCLLCSPWACSKPPDREISDKQWEDYSERDVVHFCWCCWEHVKKCSGDFSGRLGRSIEWSMFKRASTFFHCSLPPSPRYYMHSFGKRSQDRQSLLKALCCDEN